MMQCLLQTPRPAAHQDLTAGIATPRTRTRTRTRRTRGTAMRVFRSSMQSRQTAQRDDDDDYGAQDGLLLLACVVPCVSRLVMGCGRWRVAYLRFLCFSTPLHRLANASGSGSGQ